VLTVKQKLRLSENFENRESVTKLAKYCGMIQTEHNIINNKTKFSEFLTDCDSGAAPSNSSNM
jgi:hypothetical protein